MTTETVELKDYGWCIVELMGHRTRVGRCTDEQVAGGLLLRIDIPVRGTDEDGNAGEEYTTEYYGSSAIYCMQPVSEEVARDQLGTRDRRPMRPVEYRPQSQLEDLSEDDPDDPIEHESVASKIPTENATIEHESVAD